MWQPRDLEILKAVFEHRFLTRALILPLFGVDSSLEDSNLDRRIRKLTAAGYLHRLPRENRRTEYVYALTGAGAEILRKHQIPLPFADWAEKNRAVRFQYVDHTLMVARFYVSLLIGLRELRDLCIVSYERESRPRGRYTLMKKWPSAGRVVREVIPDALMILNGIHPGAHFLEADQSTMRHGQMTEKFEDYAAMYREKRHPDLFNVPSFRVCVITKSEERALNLLNLVIEATDIRPEERRLFWFTSEETYRDVPSNVFAAIWRRADEPQRFRALVGSPLPRRDLQSHGHAQDALSIHGVN